MERQDTARRSLRVIEGGAPAGRRRCNEVVLPDLPVLGAQELAAEMGDLFAMGLLAAVPLDALADPHGMLRIDRRCRISLHELLCELRNLPWNDRHSVAAGVGLSLDAALHHSQSDLSSRDALMEPGHRRALRWNGDGQLTLTTLFRCGGPRGGVAHQLSPLLAADRAQAAPRGPLAAPPEGADLTHWSRWCLDHAGAGLEPSRRDRPQPAPVTSLSKMATRVFAMPPGRVFYRAALSALVRGAQVGAGAGAASAAWSGPQLLSLLAEAERCARRIGLRRLLQVERAGRPAVISARMSLYLNRDEATRQGAPFRGAADTLARHAPGLLSWVTRANAQRRRKRPGQNLFLPLRGAAPLPPSDAACHVIVAGAMATVLKALLRETAPRNDLALRLSGRGRARADLGAELDQLVGNICLARAVSAGWYPSENMQDLRLGQAIGLTVLRAFLESENCGAALSLRDFDGRSLSLQAHARAFGQGQVQLLSDGRTLAWPQEVTRPAAHLTAV